MFVTDLKEAHLNFFEVIQQDNRLSLLSRRYEFAESNVINWNYEIVFRYFYLLTLSRSNDLALIRTQYNCLRDLLGATKDYHHYLPTSLLRNVMLTIEQHPEWKSVHIAAYNDLVGYFTNTKFEDDQINEQTLKEKFTALHLAISKNFKRTIDAIRLCKPSITELDFEGCSILHYAVKSSYEILEVILKVENVRQLLAIKNNAGLNPIQLACFNRMSRNLTSLMNFGLTVKQLTIYEPKNSKVKEDEFDDVNIIKLTRYEINDLDFEHIHKGGCPLHWSKSGFMTEKLLQLGFHVNSFNLDGDTPLLMMVRSDRLKCALTLLCNGANVNQQNLEGDSPLHVAVTLNKYNMTKTLIVFDADVDLKNGKQYTCLHLAAKSQPKQTNFIDLLKKVGAKGCTEFSNNFSCQTNCMCHISNLSKKSSEKIAQESVNHGIHMRNLLDLSLKRNQVSSDSSKETKSSKISRLICFDGGGVKGLIAIQILIELQKYLKKNLRDYFDWIIGTSTGAMISFVLARNQSLRELRKMYLSFKDHVLTGGRPYKADRLEELMRNHFGADVPLSEVCTGQKFLVLTTARLDYSPPILHFFRSFPIYSGETIQADEQLSLPAWRALRASSTAPTYFPNYFPYSDGGLISNNPTLYGITEFLRYRQSIERNNIKPNNIKVDLPQLKFVLSIGTGQIKRIKNDRQSNKYNKLYNAINHRSTIRIDLLAQLTNLIKSNVTNSNDHVVSRSNYLCSSLGVPFFRLSPVIPKVSLNETDDLKIIDALWEVKLYAQRMQAEFKMIAALLEQDGLDE